MASPSRALPSAPPSTRAASSSQAIQTYAGNNAPPGLRDISGLYIHDNTFTHLTPLPGGSDQYEGIYINPQTDPASETDPVVIEYNTFSGELLRAVTTERSRTVIQDNSLATDAGALIAGYPLGILVRSSAAQDHVTVRYNRIDDSGAATFGRGVVIGSAGQAMDAIVAHSNVISDCGTAGIVVGCDLSADDDVIVSDNSITDNAAGLDFTGAAGSWTVDAEFNWWGAGDGPSGAGPGSGDSVSADVDFSPWLTGPP